MSAAYFKAVSTAIAMSVLLFCWVSHLKKYQEQLEKVQSKTVCFVADLKSVSDVSEPMETLGCVR